MSRRYYNHYSWLRTIEDLFDVSRVSPGLDREGHLGYAAQPGLAPFGPDVFNDPGGRASITRASFPVGRIVAASHAHPWVAIQGDTVAVRSRSARVLATVIGPAVPRASSLAAPASTPCTFTVKLHATSGNLPLSPSAFAIVDELGHVQHPLISGAGGSALPARLMPGRTITLSARAVLPVGAGQMTFSPDGGAPIVSWDFDVELD